MLRFPERCFEKIHVKSSNVIEDLVTMSGDEPFVISVDALREDGKVLKHFNIPIELPIRPKGDSRTSFATTLPLKKRYQINQEQNDKAARYRRLARKPILKRMLQESGGKFVRVSPKVDVQNDERPLDLSRIRRQEVQENSVETQRLHQAPRERVIQVSQPPQQQAVHYPVPLRYLVQPYPQVRLIEETPPEVPRVFAPPQNTRASDIPRLHNSTRPIPSYSYPHVLQSNPYMRPSISYHHPIPGRYYDAHQEDSVPPRRSYHLAVPPNYAPVSEVPYIEDGYVVPRHLAEHYAQYPSIPQRYVTHAPVICRPPPPVEVVPKNPPAVVYSNQPNTYAFHPPSCIAPSNYVPQVTHHPSVPQNPPHVPEIPSNRQRSTRVPTDVRHLRDFLLENAARQQRHPAQKVNNYPDEIPVFRLRNPTFNSAPSSAHDPPKVIRYSHHTK